MSHTCVVGLQWGDEGKGKVIDYLSKDSDVIARFQGGSNAGHTIVIGKKEFKLSLIPSGILRGDKIVYIGSGVVLDPESLIKEVSVLKSEGIEVNAKNLFIADNATVILKIYKEVDEITEEKSANLKIGTTKKGIGFAYQDRAGRRAIRVCDLFDEDLLKSLLKNIITYYTPVYASAGIAAPSFDQTIDELRHFASLIKSHVISPWEFVLKFGQKRVLFEGAQGFGLDVLHGTYPFVTSSNTVNGNIFSGTGLGLCNVNRSIGVLKSYSTRVGSGPFPTEDGMGLGSLLQVEGAEFGTVTGRKRRCGPLDLVFARQAAKICGINELCITKIDVLDVLPEIPVCTSYEIDGKTYDYMPSSARMQSIIKPIYQIQKGWLGKKTSGLKNISDLPKEAIDYVKYIESFVGVKVTIVSTGKERDDIITVL